MAVHLTFAMDTWWSSNCVLYISGISTYCIQWQTVFLLLLYISLCYQ